MKEIFLKLKKYKSQIIKIKIKKKVVVGLQIKVIIPSIEYDFDLFAL